MHPLVGIIMGSDSDWPKIKGAAAALAEFHVPHEVRVMSADRTPDIVQEYASTATKRGLKVILAAAGGAAHLAGVVAAHTILPVIAIPVQTDLAGGLDSLLSMVQMPGDVPVATVGVGSGGRGMRDCWPCRCWVWPIRPCRRNMSLTSAGWWRRFWRRMQRCKRLLRTSRPEQVHAVPARKSKRKSPEPRKLVPAYMFTMQKTETLHWVGGPDGHLRMIDQTRLPVELVEVDCLNVESVWEAIKMLRVRGRRPSASPRLMASVSDCNRSPGRTKRLYFAAWKR